MDAADDLRHDLFENLAEQGEMPAIAPAAPYKSTGQAAEIPKIPAKAALDLNDAVDPLEEDLDLLNTLPDGTVLSPDDIAVLKRMIKDYCHALVGGKNVIVGQRYCQVQGLVLTFEPLGEFKKKFMHAPLIGGRDNVGRGRPKNPAQAWLEWSGKNLKLGGVGFFPDPKKCPADVLNFYRGLQVKPKAGDVKPYLDHLRYVICAGHEPSYHYLVGWMAHLFQKPDIKPSVAIVLKSVEGTGKGTMAEPLLRILGSHGNKTNGAYAIAGRFNGLVANRLLIFADEVDLTDKHVADRLKGIISETTVNLERKGLEIEPLPNYCRLIFASNHARVLSAGIRERRYLVLEPSDRFAQDPGYFRRLWHWINHDGPAKLLNYLLIVDIADFDPYRCPQTAALIAEKLGNLSGVNQFFYHQIAKAEPFDGRVRIRAAELVDDFVAWSAEEGEKVSKAAAANLTGRMTAKLGIAVHGRSDRGGGKFYELPERAALVQRFAFLLDIPVEELE
jgi:putative DNA primase/helicase